MGSKWNSMWFTVEKSKREGWIESCQLLLTLKLTFMNHAPGSSLPACLDTVICYFIFQQEKKKKIATKTCKNPKEWASIVMIYPMSSFGI